MTSVRSTFCCADRWHRHDFLYGGAGTNTFELGTGLGHGTIMDRTTGTGDQIDLSALAGLGAITDPTQIIVNSSDVITSSHTGTNSITLNGLNSTLTASNFISHDGNDRKSCRLAPEASCSRPPNYWTIDAIEDAEKPSFTSTARS